MGLIKAAMGAAGGVMADQWKEYFYCEALPVDVLAVRGRKKVSGRSSNKGGDNVISNGSLIAVADGQCMLIVDQGKIVDVCAEPGEYTYDMSTEPSVFTGSLGAGISAVFKISASVLPSAARHLKNREFIISIQRKLPAINTGLRLRFRSGW